MKFTATTQTNHEGDNSIMREGYTSQAKKALAYAVRTAEKCGHNYVGTEHLLIGLLNVEDGTAGMVLSEFHVDAGQLTELIDRLIAPGGNTATESRPGYTPRVRRVLENAEAEAARFKSRAVGTEHLLIAILKRERLRCHPLTFHHGHQHSEIIQRHSHRHGRSTVAGRHEWKYKHRPRTADKRWSADQRNAGTRPVQPRSHRARTRRENSTRLSAAARKLSV